MSFKDHFSSQSASYAAHRPTYPASLVQWLRARAPSGGLAVDVGCGTGQLSSLLADAFDHVAGIDASETQIRNAQPHPRVDYRVAPAERTGLPDACADLITVAQAAHWLDLPAFYAEVRRIARPGALLALISYGVVHVDGDIDALVQRFYSETMGPYWPPERRHVETGYADLPFPFDEIADKPSLSIEVFWTLADFLGYVDTWSATGRAEKAVGRGPIDAFAGALAAQWGDPGTRRRVHWPLSIRAAVPAGD